MQKSGNYGYYCSPSEHDDFLADPTHVRSITVLGLSLYDKEKIDNGKKKMQLIVL